jgi:hypothetical protein
MCDKPRHLKGKKEALRGYFAPSLYRIHVDVPIKRNVYLHRVEETAIVGKVVAGLQALGIEYAPPVRVLPS